MSLRNVTYIKGDITNKNDLSQLNSSHFDYVIHLAAAISVAESMTNPQKYYTTNIVGSQNVYEQAIVCGVKKVFSASTAAYYGDCGRSPIKEEQKYGGISPYAESKYRMEQLIDKNGCLKTDISASTRFFFCRFFNVYGPR